MMAIDDGVMPRRCRLCSGAELPLLVDLGMLPVSRPHRPRGGAEPRYPLAVHRCVSCGLLQVLKPIAPELLYPDSENYTTSFQAHPHVEELIRTLLAHTDAASAIEVGCNDGAFLDSLRSAGFGPLTGIEPNHQAADLAKQKGFSVHSAMLTEELAHEIAAANGQVDLVAARHVVEHVVDLDAFFRAVSILLRPDGYFLLELPHVEPGLVAGNPCLLWEEHVNYFVEPVILRMLAKYGYVAEVKRLYTFGGGIIAFLARLGPAAAEIGSSPTLAEREFGEYGARVAAFRDGLRQVVGIAGAAGWEIGVYGAANRSNIVINHAGIGDQIDCVIDDRVDLAGQVFPGVPGLIRPLLEISPPDRGLLCLLGVGAEAERKVSARVRTRFSDRPVVFSSLVYPRDGLHGFRCAAAEIRASLSR
jgi:SAM-dependent methyltransferase